MLYVALHVYSHFVVCLLSCFSSYFYPPLHIPLVVDAEYLLLPKCKEVHDMLSELDLLLRI